MYAYIGIWILSTVSVAIFARPSKKELIQNAIHDAGWCVLKDGTKLLSLIDPLTQHRAVLPYREAHMSNSPWYGKKKPKITNTHEIEFTLMD